MSEGLHCGNSAPRQEAWWLAEGEGLGQMPRDRGLRGPPGCPTPHLPYSLTSRIPIVFPRSCPDGLIGLGSGDFWGRRWEGGEELPTR